MRNLPKISAVKAKPAPSRVLQKRDDFSADLERINQLYNEIKSLWETFEGNDQRLFRVTEPKLEELLTTLDHLLKKYSIEYNVNRSRSHVAMSKFHSKSANYVDAVVSQGEGLTKLSYLIEDLPALLKQALLKRGYGYDIAGEISEGSGPRAEQENIDDMGEPQRHHETPKNLANSSKDFKAVEEFPTLEKCLETNIIPPRNR